MNKQVYVNQKKCKNKNIMLLLTFPFLCASYIEDNILKNQKCENWFELNW